MIMTDTARFLFLFALSLVSSLLLVSVAINWAPRLGLMDQPGNRKIHLTAIPRVGGIVVFSSVLVVMVFSYITGWLPVSDFKDHEEIWLVLGVSLGTALVGLVDDIFTLLPKYKLLGQAVIGALFVLFGCRFEILHIPGFEPIYLHWLSLPITLFWILATVNAFNFIDGVDGLAGTVSMGIFFLVGVAAALCGNSEILILCLTFMGALGGFLIWNWSPARAYLGDAGSNGLGMLVACSLLSLGNQPRWFLARPESTQVNPIPYEFFVLTLLMAFPAIEITLSVIRRIFRGRALFRADKGHIHHRLLKFDWSHPAICMAALFVTLVLGGASLAVLSHEYGKAAWLLVFSGGFVGLSLSILGFFDFLSADFVARTRNHFLIADHFIKMQRLKLRFSNDLGEVMALLSQTCAEFGVQNFSIFMNLKGWAKKICIYSWERQSDVQQEYLNYFKVTGAKESLSRFKESISLEAGVCEAHWVFEPHIVEGDLDVEYRVLVSDFMREVLVHAYPFQEQGAEPVHIKVPGLAYAKVRSSLLHRRQQLATLEKVGIHERV